MTEARHGSRKNPFFREIERLQQALSETECELAKQKEKIAQANRALQAAQKALEKEKKSLERTVNQRTRQLNQLNKALQNELTERIQIQPALEESERKYRTLIEHSNDAIYVLQDNRFVLVNQQFTELLGLRPEDVLNRDFWEFIAPESRPLIEERLKQQEASQPVAPVFEFAVLNKKQEPVLCEASVATITYEGRPAIQGILRDITERRRLEKQLQQAQKMEAIGRLAGGVAHDFNNLLTVIRVYAEMALNRLDPNHPVHEDITRIKKAEEKATRLTTQLLAFSRRQIRQPVVLNLNDLINDLTRMLRRIIGEDIELNSILDPNLWPVHADLGQMEQVVMNLVVNARDAMPQGGKLTLETLNVVLDEIYARLHAGVKPGHYVMLAVSDTGIGMDEQTISQIFEPFFTTKTEGTGLGLATVYGIVRQNEGHIWVYSEPGKGTTFKIYLPRTTESLSPRDKDVPAGMSLEGNEHILLVEDDEQVRQVTERLLREYGYRVTAVPSPAEALQAVRTGTIQPDLVVTDVVMPGMDGRDLARELAQIKPGTPVIFVSGYTENAIIHHGILDDGLIFLQKPFAPMDLLRLIRKTLSR